MSERTVKEQEELERITSEVERAVERSLMLRVLDKSVVNKLAEKFGFKPEEAAVFLEPELPERQLRPDIVLAAGEMLFVVEITNRASAAAAERLLTASETIKRIFKAERVVPVLAYTGRPLAPDRVSLERLERLGIVLLQL